MHKYEKQNVQKLITLGFIISIISTISLLPVNASGEINIHMNKIVGTNISNKISGKFRINVDAVDEIIHINLLFNGSLVKEEDGNELEFTFQTHDYPLGIMNITAIGLNQAGDTFQTSKIVEFFDSSTFDTVLYVITGIVVVPFVIYYIKKGLKKKKKPENLDDLKKKIRIDIDKDFS
ncbi:MAG: hypothetical protein DRO88_13825 [Promethearchaeia archaeon]|nr:MAG: hypothetical protein DRO88_13825 [Candidatus Lokiarchaeia archaeon]